MKIISILLTGFYVGMYAVSLIIIQLYNVSRMDSRIEQEMDG